MEIEIKRTVTSEHTKDNVTYGLLNDLEDYLNDRFRNKDYGESVVKYFFGFELYKFDGGFAQFFSDDIESWKTKSKCFVANAHFDWNTFIDLNLEETLKLISEEFSKSIGRIENMKRKPKHFDFKQFRKDFEIIMSEFEIQKNAG